MKKLKLDDLHVDTFTTSPDGPVMRGTVKGNADVTDYIECGPQTQNGCVYPSTSCAPGQTFAGATCRCLYPVSNIYVCCSNEGCSAGTGPC